ncbi:hypothetical protein BCR41DRAFT_388537 [Lobosporangium transversale]|uniref:Uncharacterized protein n=1 Tax=Lobosporangium transversale TaxID=64571 RepID=A0A1Y2GJ10_9FUNG|nr:hypothetical protein BCR41DRAFT_388537 [Lobosporangium transversale]ORZ08827.1 hypothetical protein BCR41DRAFT_388537 [Lobosporangium transversale]|eukprot:XP_021878610.1 hypothetical protein BCR41DRAFT_388537 [Lobosporangium transversale]
MNSLEWRRFATEGLRMEPKLAVDDILEEARWACEPGGMGMEYDVPFVDVVTRGIGEGEVDEGVSDLNDEVAQKAVNVSNVSLLKTDGLAHRGYHEVAGTDEKMMVNGRCRYDGQKHCTDCQRHPLESNVPVVHLDWLNGNAALPVMIAAVLVPAAAVFHGPAVIVGQRVQL